MIIIQPLFPDDLGDIVILLPKVDDADVRAASNVLGHPLVLYS
jgi:hypothetical protein